MKNIKSSQKGFENVVEGTRYDDYHIDTRGQGILDVENIIDAIESRGNQAVLTVQSFDGSVQHTYFTSKSWKDYKDTKNAQGIAVTDVWITEVKGGSYVRNSRKITSSQEPLYWGDEHDQRDVNMYTREEYIEKYGEEPPEWKRVTEVKTDLWNSRRPIKSGVENLDKIKEFEKRYAKIKGDVDKEEDLIQYYVGRYGIPEETLDEIAFNLRINSSRRPIKSSVRWSNDDYVVETFEEYGNGEFYVSDKDTDGKRFCKTFWSEKDAVEWAKNNPLKKVNSSRQIKSARYIATDPESGEVLGSADTYEEAVNEWGEDVTITDSEAAEGQQEENGLFSSRKITSAVDGGWEVRSSDVPKALDLFVEYFGKEDALEEIAKAMGDNVLEENIDWIAQQWGFAEDIEELDDAWDKYETAKEIMGESELFNNLTQAAGYDELAEDLAFIFRMNDFREWDKYDNEDEEDEDLESENPELYNSLEDAKNREVDWGEVAKNMYRNAGWSEEDIDEITNNRSFPVKTVKNIMSGKWSEDYAAECIAQKQDINVGYARQILSSWIEQYKPKLIKSGILDIAEDINAEFDIDGDLESWAEQYTNRKGKSNTVGGEMVRAAMQIIYRYNNDGDMIGRGYGNETVNAAARYLIEKVDMTVNEQIQKWLDHEERASDSEYDSFIESLQAEVEDALRTNSSLFQKPNKEDYWNWKTEDDVDVGFDECYLEDGDGNQYWFQKVSDDRWRCTGIELDPYTHTYSEGDTINEGDEFSDEILSPGEEWGSFEAEGLIYEYSGEDWDEDREQYTSWQITKVTPVDPYCDEGDTADFYDLEPDELYGYTLFDHNGNEIDERTFLASSLITSRFGAGKECIIEIDRHKDNNWEMVAEADDERGWTLMGRAKVFADKNEAKNSQLMKDLERAGYSVNKGNLKISEA